MDRHCPCECGLTWYKRQTINYVQVSVVFVCFVVLLVRVGPNWSNTFLGYIPSKALFQTRPDALYTGKRQFSIPTIVELNTSLCSCWDSRCHSYAARTVPRVVPGYSG